MSRTANRPKGGNSVNVSTHMGFVGTKSTIAESPDFMAFGLSKLSISKKLIVSNS